jgi:hypothetical protein
MVVTGTPRERQQQQQRRSQQRHLRQPVSDVALLLFQKHIDHQHQAGHGQHKYFGQYRHEVRGDKIHGGFLFSRCSRRQQT